MGSSESLKEGFSKPADSLKGLESLDDISNYTHLEDIITRGGRRIFVPPECDFDMYQCSEYQVEYKYFNTDFHTQLGPIKLFACEAEVILPDGTTQSAARPTFRNDIIRKKALEGCCGFSCGGKKTASAAKIDF